MAFFLSNHQRVYMYRTHPYVAGQIIKQKKFYGDSTELWANQASLVFLRFSAACPADAQ